MPDALCSSCGSCGFPMRAPEDFAGSRLDSPYCSTCARPSGQLLPFDEVLAANAAYLAREQGLHPDAAERMALALLLSMPAWRDTRAERHPASIPARRPGS